MSLSPYVRTRMEPVGLLRHAQRAGRRRGVAARDPPYLRRSAVEAAPELKDLRSRGLRHPITCMYS